MSDAARQPPGIDDLDERLRSRALAATGHATTRSVRQSGDTVTVDARSGDRIVHLELCLRDDGSVGETNDSFVVDDVRRISAPRGGATVDIEVAGPLRVVPVAVEVAATLGADRG